MTMMMTMLLLLTFLLLYLLLMLLLPSPFPWSVSQPNWDEDEYVADRSVGCSTGVALVQGLAGRPIKPRRPLRDSHTIQHIHNRGNNRDDGVELIKR